MENNYKQSFEKDLIRYNFESIKSKKEKGYFKLICDACNKMINDEVEKHALDSRKYLSIANISKITGITRQTIYSYPYLIDLIEEKRKIFSKIDNSEIILQLKKENENLKDNLHSMVLRDIELENYREENKQLKNQIKSMCEQIKSLNNQLKEKNKDSFFA